MPIFYNPKIDKKILFIHVPKAGGGSIEAYLQKNGFEMQLFCSRPLQYSYRCSPQHFHYKLLSSILDTENFDCVFALIRNPLDRFISEYRWRCGGPLTDGGIDNFCNKVLQIYEKDEYVLDNHLRPQFEFLDKNITTFKLELGLQKLIPYIESKLGTKFRIRNIPNQKKDYFRRYRRVPSVLEKLKLCTPSLSTISLIEQFYKRDYDELNYDLSSFTHQELNIKSLH